MTDHDDLIRQLGEAEESKVERHSRRAAVVAFVRRMNRRTRRVAVVAFASGLLFISGVALAEWLATGTGSGYAKAANAENLTTSVTVASESLYPGGTGDLALTVNNPNPFPVTVTAVVGAGPIVSSNAACNAGGHGVTFANQTGLSLLVPANGNASFVLVDAVSMAETSANECQGATFEIPVALTGVSGTSGAGEGDGGPVDADLDSYASIATGGNDCNDANSLVHPNATETPNGVDDNCDGTIDEGFYTLTVYPDLDGDAFGDFFSVGQTFIGSLPPQGFSLSQNDCNDADHTVNPGATESFNGVDDDCDGVIDDHAVGGIRIFPDLDGDGYGDFSSAGEIAGWAPPGFSQLNTDCDDANPDRFPGATEVFDGIDNDCDGVIDDNAVGVPL